MSKIHVSGFRACGIECYILNFIYGSRSFYARSILRKVQNLNLGPGMSENPGKAYDLKRLQDRVRR